MNEIKLLPCPFCGVQLENEPPSSIWVHPQNNCLLSLRGIVGKEQFATWNTRKPIERIVERLEEASHWETVIDEDGYAEDVGEVIYLDKAIEIVNQVAEEYSEVQQTTLQRIVERLEEFQIDNEYEENAGFIDMCIDIVKKEGLTQ